MSRIENLKEVLVINPRSSKWGEVEEFFESRAEWSHEESRPTGLLASLLRMLSRWLGASFDTTFDKTGLLLHFEISRSVDLAPWEPSQVFRFHELQELSVEAADRIRSVADTTKAQTDNLRFVIITFDERGEFLSKGITRSQAAPLSSVLQLKRAPSSNVIIWPRVHRLGSPSARGSRVVAAAPPQTARLEATVKPAVRGEIPGHYDHDWPDPDEDEVVLRAMLEERAAVAAVELEKAGAVDQPRESQTDRLRELDEQLSVLDGLRKLSD